MKSNFQQRATTKRTIQVLFIIVTAILLVTQDNYYMNSHCLTATTGLRTIFVSSFRSIGSSTIPNSSSKQQGQRILFSSVAAFGGLRSNSHHSHHHQQQEGKTFSSTSTALLNTKKNTNTIMTSTTTPPVGGWKRWVQSNNPNAEFPPEKGRYHLYVAYACPWAHRTLLARGVKGLQDTIGVTFVYPVWQRTRPDDPNDTHTGWVFADPSAGPRTNSDGNGGPFESAYTNNTPDPYDPNNKCIRDIYAKLNDNGGKYSVPILYDTKQQTIVSNESADILRMLNSEFNNLATNPTLDLYPTEHRDAIDEVNAWVLPSLNNGVYRCGNAQTQPDYDKAITEVTEAFDKVDSILQSQRYLVKGVDHITEADLRLFVTLLRFDEVYGVYFKTNTRYVWNTPNILNYLRDIYQYPGVADTVNMEQIKLYHYGSHPKMNYYSIVPRGNPNYITLLQQPHNRG